MSSCQTELSTSPHHSDTTDTSVLSPSRRSQSLMKDIYLWRKKKLSLLIVVISTATWAILEIYGFNFIPVVCWMAMFIITSVFLWGNTARLFHKEMPSAMSVWEVSEEFTMVSQNAARVFAEEGILWTFRVGAEDKWFIFIGMVAGLWLISIVAGWFSFLSFSYIGLVIGMTVPLIFFKYDGKIKGFRVRMEMQGSRWYRKVVVDWFQRKTESENKVAEPKVKKVE